MLLTVTLLSRLAVGHPDIWMLHIVERNILKSVGIGVIWLSKGKLTRSGALKVVYLLRSLTKTARRVVSQALMLVRIVQTPKRKGGIYRRDVDLICIAINIPLEISQCADRVTKEV